ncbi:sigma factor-like helix-turn-helix DNA-binding protein [Enemella evansiae]|uniref:sigma factor-like helix-turn-helix DNA-binding protein n=1 Tax=Enemella evansiae TaxID=2016499 RepID=UPI00105D979A|nr:sigma factor-like helix-turn-helix DNA-binding protein [Enemella evansiae]
MEYCTVEAAEVLSAAEEIELARRIEVGLYADRLHQAGGHPAATMAQLDRLVAEGESAAERFLMANVRLVSMVSRPMARATGACEPDLFQEGFAALVTALYRFDHRHGTRFATYALPWIRSGVAEAIGRQQVSPAPIDRVRIRQQWWRLAQSLRREPRAAEVAELLGVPANRVERAMHAEATVLLFDGANHHEPADPTAQQRLSRVVDAPAPVHDWLAALPKLEARVLWLRFGFAGEVTSYAETARILHLDASRVRRLEHRGLDRLREVCHTDDLPAAG